MSSFSARYGPWALVTGASAGIGAAFARQLAARGLNVALLARCNDRLQALAAELTEAHGVETLPLSFDLRHPDLAIAIAGVLGDRQVGLLVNNAAQVRAGRLLDRPLSEQVDELHVHCRAPLILAHTLGRAMAKRGRGGMVFVSSTVARYGGYRMVGYTAAKAWNLCLATGLARELEGVDVQALLPGMTRTEGLEALMDLERVPYRPMEPGEVARASLDGLGRRTVVVPGLKNRLTMHLLARLPAGLRERMLARAMVFRG